MNRAEGWAKFGRLLFAPPERMEELELEITAQATEPHFAVDPAWPPRLYNLLED